jgi:hypothetical protein
MAEKKGQKFDRCRNSPSHKAYQMARRDRINQIKRLKRHLKKNPNDQKNASTLLMLSKGSYIDEVSGPIPEFPKPPPHRKGPKPEGMEEVEVEFRRHHRAKVNGKNIVVLDEHVASEAFYEVVSDSNVVQDRGRTVEDVEKCWRKSHGAVSIVERKGDKAKVLYSKPATPPPGFESRIREAFAG